MSKNILWFRNFPHGRFGNAAFQYLFARYAVEVLGCELILGEVLNEESLLPWKLFSIGNYDLQIQAALMAGAGHKMKLGENRSSSPKNDLDVIKKHFRSYPGSVLVVEGYFQYDTHFFYSDADYFQIFQKYFFPDKNGINDFQRILAIYHSQIKEVLDGYLISMHIRRGDYLLYSPTNHQNHSVFYPLNLELVLNYVKKIIETNRISKPLIYVASDDLDFCENYFGEHKLHILTRNKLLPKSGRTDLSELMTDLAVLSSSKMTVCSNSSFSILSTLLNKDSKVFIRQTSEGLLMPFDPKATVVLYGN
jgi:hypothetical protein